MKTPEGWTAYSMRGDVAYDVGEVLYENGRVRPITIYITPSGARIGCDALEGDVVERNIFSGRYKAALECFVHSKHDAEARYYFLAAEALLSFDLMQLQESPELEREAMQKAWQLGWIDLNVVLGRCFPDVLPLYASTMTLEQISHLLWYAITGASWMYDLDGVGKEYTSEHEGAIITLMGLAFPHAAAAVDIFRDQIIAELSKFEKQPDLAKSYVLGLVNPKPVDSFELPNLG